jgi:hypothetical protein
LEEEILLGIAKIHAFARKRSTNILAQKARAEQHARKMAIVHLVSSAIQIIAAV